MLYFTVFPYSRVILKCIWTEIVKGGIMNYLHTTKALQMEVYKSIGYNVNLNAIMKKEKIKKEPYE